MEGGERISLPEVKERGGEGKGRAKTGKERQLMREEEDDEEPCFCFRGHFFHFN